MGQGEFHPCEWERKRGGGGGGRIGRGSARVVLSLLKLLSGVMLALVSNLKVVYWYNKTEM